MDLKTKKTLIAVFIAFLMITSIAGFIFTPESNTQIKKYKDVDFARDGDRWTTDFGGKRISILADPESLQEQKIVSINNLNFAEKIYLSINPKEDLGRVSIELNSLLSLLTPRVVNSCYVDIDECKSSPIKQCKDATISNKVILIKLENTTSINYHQNCLEIKGKEDEIIKFLDSMIVSAIQPL